jgi:hypothetical protein
MAEAPIASRLRSQKSTRVTRGRSLRTQKPYRRPSIYREEKASVDKDYFNDLVVEAAQQVLKSDSGRVIVLDHYECRTCSHLIAAGVDPRRIDVVQWDEEAFSIQKETLARSEFKGVTLAFANVFDVITPQHVLLILDLTCSCPSEGDMKIIREWSEGQSDRSHAVILTIAGRDRSGERTVRHRMDWIEQQLPSMNKHFELGYKAAENKQSMYATKFASWPVPGGEVQYRPLKVVRTGYTEEGEKRFLIQWWGFTKVDEKDWFSEDDDAVQALKEDGKVSAS